MGTDRPEAEALRLDTGLELHCPHCDRWHRLTRATGESDHPYARRMLYFTCDDPPTAGLYYAGQMGGVARFPIRRTTPQA